MFVGREEGSICVSVCAAGVSAFGAWDMLYIACVLVCVHVRRGDGYNTLVFQRLTRKCHLCSSSSFSSLRLAHADLFSRPPDRESRM